MNIINALRSIERLSVLFAASALFWAGTMFATGGVKIGLLIMMLILLGGLGYPLVFLFLTARAAIRDFQEETLEEAAVKQYECLRIYAGIGVALAAFLLLAAMIG